MQVTRRSTHEAVLLGLGQKAIAAWGHLEATTAANKHFLKPNMSDNKKSKLHCMQVILLSYSRRWI